MNHLFFAGVVPPHHHPRRALAVLLLAAAALTSGAAAATTYQVIQLPPPPGRARAVEPLGINEAGEIVGFAERRVTAHAVAWSAAPDYTPRWLPEGSATGSYAVAINDAGYVIGEAFFADSPEELQAMMWGPNDVPIRLGEHPPGGQTGNGAFDINANGTIVGEIYDGNGIQSPAFWLTPAVAHVFVRLDDFFEYVTVLALNDFNTVVGYGSFEPAGPYTAFRATPGSDMQLLDGLPGDNGFLHAVGVNEAGEAVGHGDNFPLGGIRALLWDADGSVLDLGDLPGGIDYDYETRDINNAGEVIGVYYHPGVFDYQPFVWTAATGMQSILDLIDVQLEPGDVIRINAINDAGVMAGYINPAAPGPFIPIVLVPQP